MDGELESMVAASLVKSDKVYHLSLSSVIHGTQGRGEVFFSLATATAISHHISPSIIYVPRPHIHFTTKPSPHRLQSLSQILRHLTRLPTVVLDGSPEEMRYEQMFLSGSRWRSWISSLEVEPVKPVALLSVHENRESRITY
jgi:hypothetical protein